MEDPRDPANPVSSPVCHGHSKFLYQNPCLGGFGSLLLVLACIYQGGLSWALPI